jgi:glutamine---fructose-6-phosphate transaminase (isomerizing)
VTLLPENVYGELIHHNGQGIGFLRAQEITLTWNPAAQTDFTGYLVVAASQSGRTPEIVRSLQLARAAGGRTVAVTNDRESALAGAAKLALYLDAGPERAVPATKTVTAELVAFALIAQAVRNIGSMRW